MAKLYTLEVPIRFAVEADNVGQARVGLRKLVEQTQAVLPTGVSLRVDEGVKYLDGVKQS